MRACGAATGKAPWRRGGAAEAAPLFETRSGSLVDDEVAAAEDLLDRLRAVPVAGEDERRAVPERHRDGVVLARFTLVGHGHLKRPAAADADRRVRICDVRQVRL